jgi:hypothetical protein
VIAPRTIAYDTEGSELGAGGVGSNPRSKVDVASGAGAGVTGATLVGLTRLMMAGAAFFAAAFFGAAFFGAAFFGAAFFDAAFFGADLRAAAFFAFFATLGLLGFFNLRVFFFAALVLAAVRFAFATERFFPLPFFFAMVSLLLAVLRLLAVRVAPKKSAVICA